ncbi:prepilin peptidase [Bacillus bombysepticus]|uniref:prepilin peptidase n=1 Tax=Bacillus bombysepticus TaxID=658666 RepID=UPI0030182546
MTTLYLALTIYLLVIATLDIFTFKIKNSLILVGILGFPPLIFLEGGFDALKTSAISALICSFSLYYIWKGLYWLGIPLIGAGDIKLFMVLSMVLGIGNTFTTFYFALIFGGLSFIFILSPKVTIRMIQDFFYFLFYGIPFHKEAKLKKIPYSVPIALVTYLVLAHPNFLPFTF